VNAILTGSQISPPSPFNVGNTGQIQQLNPTGSSGGTGLIQTENGGSTNTQIQQEVTPSTGSACASGGSVNSGGSGQGGCTSSAIIQTENKPLAILTGTAPDLVNQLNAGGILNQLNAGGSVNTLNSNGCSSGNNGCFGTSTLVHPAGPAIRLVDLCTGGSGACLTPVSTPIDKTPAELVDCTGNTNSSPYTGGGSTQFF
jgi:hypothetical protein